MSVDFIGRLQEGGVRVGTKQTTKMVEQGKAAVVYVAQDADSRLIGRITQLCQQHGVAVTPVETMRELGKACGIDVGTAMAVVVEE
ncbi:ribosomal L7Ae/L30e/S12e/Gadd45 family protein [Cohnella nanjingensis]|uniref:Ribosomal L7Ae/L30e/S12e/Gadd45 family protein n=1 Tax=Cohnella nanjingensis TaxID=1387779 RepID=A0A7X0RWN0_9BACL|nr:ribosomal L7Ae/L30e/S12e/Gadd45 family protein [Cohnella nanjingensis]MBB6675044.1 ribosomal L7Ae/L30e/S12e/Gadd45 family protein [Cohnella nanjingensis]